ncbi:hypothetical protein [Enterococcus larvae]|uniref:hypothetical protein n=1 Tax=Enterococcus larvae TaxID=2794352 RepID=UPI003F2B26B3
MKKDGATSSTGKTEQVLSKLQTQSKPMTYDIELAETKGLAENGHLSETFDQVYTMYRKVFENYLIGQLDISDFDQKLQDSSLGYSPVEESEQTIYQKDSSLDTTYIYLRNNLHIERLSTEELEIFRNLKGDPEFLENDKLKAIVESSYPKVIPLYDREDKELETSYDPSGNPSVLNRALVFEVAYKVDFDGQGNIIDRENEAAKKEYLETIIIPEMTAAFSHKLGDVPVAVLINDVI